MVGLKVIQSIASKSRGHHAGSIITVKVKNHLSGGVAQGLIAFCDFFPESQVACIKVFMNSCLSPSFNKLHFFTFSISYHVKIKKYII